MKTNNPHTGASYQGGTHFSLGKSGNPVRTVGGTLYYGGQPGLNGFNQMALTAPAITQSIGNGTAISSITSLFTSLGFRSGFSEAPPFISTNNGVINGISGDFAKQTAGRYIVYGYNTVAFQYIAGTAGTNVGLRGNAGQHPWRNAFAPFIRTHNVVTLTPNGGAPNGWSYVTGFQVNAGVNSVDSLNAEVAPGSYAIPGKIFFLSTGKSLTTKTLPAKTD